jgi:hypothetical protein
MTLTCPYPSASAVSLDDSMLISESDLSCDEDFSSPSFFDNAAFMKKHRPLDMQPIPLTELLVGPLAKKHKRDTAAEISRLLDPVDVSPLPLTNLLHHACCRPNITLSEIQALIESDPLAPTRPMNISSQKTVYDCATASPITKQVKETYAYPVNLAIKHNASPEIISYLAEAGPSVLLLRDGAQEENSLMILLKHSPNNTTLIDKLLLDSPHSALLSDRRDNTCLHVACRSNAPLVVIRHLAILHPQSLRMSNYWNQAPLDIVQASAAMSTDDVSIYLWERQSRSQEYQ